MSNTTVEQFAAELKRSVDDLLKQLKSAGVEKNSGSDGLTLEDKSRLRDYLQKKNGNEGGGTISVRRTRTEESTVGGVKVETRRRSRAVVIPSAEISTECRRPRRKPQGLKQKKPRQRKRKRIRLPLKKRRKKKLKRKRKRPS